MSCRSTPAGSAWTTFARLESGLSDVQTLSAFHALRAEGEGVPAPTQAEWDRFVAGQRIEMEAAGFTDARIRSIGGRMERAAAQLPDGRSWYALRNIRERSVTESNRVNAEIAALAQQTGTSVADLTNTYEERLRTVERGRSIETPEGYTEARTAWRAAGLPADHGTYSVLTQLRAEAAAARTAQVETGEAPRRVAHVQYPNSRAIYSAGYDPTDGRLEVVFRRRNRTSGETEGTSRTYSYHSVPASVWAEMNEDGGNPGVVYNREIRNHSEFRYESIEAEEAAATARCEQCGQWRAAAHTCPTPAPAPDEAAQPAPVVVSTSRDGRRRLVTATPDDYVTPLPATPEEATTEVPVGRERTAAEHAAVGAEVNRILDEMRDADAETAAAAQRLVEAAERMSLADRINGRDDEPGVPHGVAMELNDSYDDDYYADGSKTTDGAETAAATTSLLAGLADSSSIASTVEGETRTQDEVIADLRARLTGTSSAAAAQARIAEAIPDPVPATELGIRMSNLNRFGHLDQREQNALGQNDGRHDHLMLPSATAIGDAWRAAAQQPVIMDANWQGGRYIENSEGRRQFQSFRVHGEVVYSRLSGETQVSGRELQCTCPDYRANYDCTHVRDVLGVYATALTERTAGLGRGINAEPVEVPEGARNMRAAGIPTRSDYRASRGRTTASGVGAHDQLLAPARVTDVRTAAGQTPLIIPAAWSGQRYDNSSDGLPAGRFHVTGQVIYTRPGRGQHEFTGRDLRCNCPQYREEYRCPHVEQVVDVYRERLMPATGTRGGTSTPMTEHEIAQAQQQAEAALRADWTRQEATNAEARARHAAAPAADSYSNNFDAFEADHAAALARKAAGEQVVPYMTSNALGGLFTRESGRGFGVELEFDFPRGVDRYSALQAIGRELYAAGLTPVPHQQGYHASAARGYTDNHQGGWSFEQDCTVSGEIVSPVMYDEPETWENIAKICEIVKRHGGVANAKTGSHVHVGAPSMTTQTASELMHLANSHEDVMYRISQNPERSTHRPMQWCGPNADVPQGGYREMYDVTRISSHARGMNFGGVRGGQSDHPEIRYWDGTMDPAAIQAQVKISCGMVLAAERNAGQQRPTTVRESVGSHATRLAAVRGRSRRALTSEELAEDTATFRSFMDTVFTRREDKAQATALFAITGWQRRR